MIGKEFAVEQYVVKNQKKLRRGVTTGSCAAAAAEAAARLLLTGRVPSAILLPVPAGETLALTPEEAALLEGAASCAVRKDAGDDPDVTDGIRIFARVEKRPHGTAIRGGAGVGRVTKPGLSLPVSESAINPGPRAQIEAAVRRAAAENGYGGGFLVTISAENGAEIALRTYNPHLGIVGGISILGTSGIVEPMSEAALMETTHLELKSVYEQGARVALLCPGNYGADFAREALGLDLSRAVKCSNFIGDALDHAAYLGFPEILLIGHVGKLVKLAAGVMNTHSAVADGRREVFTANAALCGAPLPVLEALMAAVSTDACIEILDAAGLREPVLARVGLAVEEQLSRRLAGKARGEYMMFSSRHGLLARSPGAVALVQKLKETAG